MTSKPVALREEEVAERLSVSAAVLRTWRSRHVGPRFCRFGRSVRYLEEDVEQFVKASAVAPIGEGKKGRTRK
jgi:predicted DNA-binding transcriptional regulator AlpA